MCMLGYATQVTTIPRRRAIVALKRVSYWSVERYGPTSFTSTWFTEDGKRRTTRYRVGHTYTTVAPTGRNARNSFSDSGNCRGFWCFREHLLDGGIGSQTIRVLIWGRVVMHHKGYRAQHMRVLEVMPRVLSA